MAIALFFCGLSVLQEWNMTSFIMILIFIFCFHFSTGGLAWVYIPEVCVDSATGLAAAGQFLNLIIISLTFEFMINSALKVYGSIWYFAAFTFVGFIFCLVMVRETRGLSDLEKKSIYSPLSILHVENNSEVQMKESTPQPTQEK